MNERDKELADEAEAYADRDFKGEINWGEAYESKLIALIRADTMEAATRAANQSWMLLAKAMIASEREHCAKVCETLGEMNKGVYGEMQIGVYSAAKSIRARGDV